MKRRISAAAVVLFVFCISGCAADKAVDVKKQIIYGMVFDVDQVREDAFSWSSWNGMEGFLKENPTYEARFLESREEKDILPNLERLSDEGCSLVWGIGEALKEPIEKSATLNKDVTYILMDYAPAEEVKYGNLSYVDFRSEQAAFLAGYAAGYATDSSIVGFVGGKQLNSVKELEKGYAQGVKYAADELGKDIDVQVQYIDMFNDSIHGKKAGISLAKEGSDVLFHAAGKSGLGVLEAAKEMDCWAIGDDVDQYEEAPGVVLLSVLKNTKEAVRSLTEQYSRGQNIQGQTFVYGLEEQGVGITKNNPNMDKYFPELYKKIMSVREKLVKGEISLLGTEEEEAW